MGASSAIGRFLIARFQNRSIAFHVIGRRAIPLEEYQVHSFDDAFGRFEPPIKEAGAIINCAPLPIIGRVMEMARCLRVKRVVAFGSTGRFTKLASSSRIEQDFVNQQIEAEQRFEKLSQQQGIAWTLFRPTMIYGGGSDLNVAFIGGFIKKFRFFPLPREARGLRQPVHADDLAGACMDALACERTFGRDYNLGGGERLLYDDLVRRIFLTLGLKPQILPLPLTVYRLLAQVVRKIPKYRFVNPDMVDRMQVDLVTDHSEALLDFGYSPRKFFPAIDDLFPSPAS